MSDQNEMKVCLLLNWEKMKESVYPVLARPDWQKRNEQQELVSTEFLDMMVTYMMRLCVNGNETGFIRINRKLLECYGITREELHRQALNNLKGDGYNLRDMESIVKEMTGIQTETGGIFAEDEKIEKGKLYVFTNRDKMYGAAGILNKEFLREKSQGKSFYILPSSVHETIFLPSDGAIEQTELDFMVSEINRTQVIPEERLTDHAYFYDAQSDELRISA